MPKMIILDGNSLMNRAFYALPPFTSAQGQPTNAVHGFLSMLFKLYTERKPDYWFVAFDKTKAHVRIDLYADYKAQRKETPELLRPQFGFAKEILRELDIPFLELEGYEADDIIACVSTQAAEDDLDVEIYTGDKDMFQLICPKITVCLTRKGISEIDEFDEARLYEVYQLMPGQITDLKGLMGDSSDNIPGVPGVGEKTALKLLWQYSTLENVLAHASEVSGKKLSASLQEHAELARLSKKLATVICDVPVEHPLESFVCHNPDTLKALAVFKRYSLNMVQKVYLKTFKPDLTGAGSAHEEASPVSEEFEVFGNSDFSGNPDSSGNSDNPDSSASSLSIDETSGLPLCPKKEHRPLSADEGFGLLADWPPGNPLAVSYRFVGDSPHKGSWIQLGLAGDDWRMTVERDQHSDEEMNILRRVLGDRSVPKTVADSKTLTYVLGNDGWDLQGVEMDLSLAAYLINANLGNYRPTDILLEEPDVSGKAEVFAVAGGLFGPDPGTEAALMQGVSSRFGIRLADLGLLPLLTTIEQPLVSVLCTIERRGITADAAHLAEMGETIAHQLVELEKEIYDLAKVTFNINSPQQLGRILFETLGLPPVKKTKTGYSTDADTLEELRPLHPIVDKILHYRQLGKLNSTYINGLQGQISDGKIHTTFQQTATATGRLSSIEPNLQNIPIRLEVGRRLRQAFTPGQPGWKLFSADYSQIELRILAHYSEDERLCRSFQEAEDVHTRTASEVFEVPIAEVTGEMRRQAKAVNFGLMYGLTDFGLARDLGIPRGEAKKYTEQYFRRYMGVKRYLEEAVWSAKETGEVRTLFNRLRRIPELKHPNRTIRQFGERVAKNTPIQGTAADIMKLAMLRVQEQMESLEAAMLLQVHDELLFEVAPQALPALAHMVKTTMENVYRLSVPLVVDCSVGDNWYEMEDYYA
ncbi:MAG: DNA polymerase I [Peptococcaceae bacterium]|nr:DNA polymerase I [Peptococcaceae bacterium]